MKISVDDVELFTLSEIKKQVMQNDVSSLLFNEDMKRRLEWVVMSKYDQCFQRLRAEWDLKLARNGVNMIPTDPDEYAKLVFSQPNYHDKAARDALSNI